ncbi:MAG: hypothetical protein IJS08_13320 [Victivallales bacterium]|nr:hypothetical protein [Victivallales bacterium]
MNHLLRKIFFWDEPAQGAFFALTFFFVGSSLWFTLFHVLGLSDCGLVHIDFDTLSEGKLFREMSEWALGQLLITLYSTVVFLRAAWRLIVHCKRNRTLLPVLSWLASMTLLIVGGLFCLIPLVYLLKHFAIHYWDSGLPDWMAVFDWFSPGGWGVAYLVAVLCMTAAVFFLVRSFARMEGKPLRNALCKAGIVLWGVFWIAYFILLGSAVVQSRQCAQTRALVEQRFGHPLSAEGLEEYYRRQDTIDGDFWKRLKECMEQLPYSLSIGGKKLAYNHSPDYWDGQLPEHLTSDILSAFDNYCQANAKSLLEVEQRFDTIPPMPEYDFKPGRLNSLYLDHYAQGRIFAIMEVSRLRVFLKRHAKSEALCAYRRIVNYTSELQREPFLRAYLVWMSVEHLRLDAIEKLLESRLLTEEELHQLAEELVELERRIPTIHQQAMYYDAVFIQDILRGLETGKLSEDDLPIAIALAQLRFFYPQLWLQGTLDKEYILLQFLAKDFTEFVRTGPSAYVFSGMFLPGNRTGNKFYALTVRMLAMQTLLRAEEHRRKYGDFPEMLSDMPTDPFSGKPMLYRYGTAEVTELVLQLTEDSSWAEDEPSHKGYELKPQTTRAKVVQIWSVGPNRRDDGGIADKTIDGKDDPCARIRLE